MSKELRQDLLDPAFEIDPQVVETRQDERLAVVGNIDVQRRSHEAALPLPRVVEQATILVRGEETRNPDVWSSFNRLRMILPVEGDGRVRDRLIAVRAHGFSLTSACGADTLAGETAANRHAIIHRGGDIFGIAQRSDCSLQDR